MGSTGDPLVDHRPDYRREDDDDYLPDSAKLFFWWSFAVGLVLFILWITRVVLT